MAVNVNKQVSPPALGKATPPAIAIPEQTKLVSSSGANLSTQAPPITVVKAGTQEALRQESIPVFGATPTVPPHHLSWFRRTFESLYTPAYLRLWLGLVMAMGAVQMQIIARGVLAYEITNSRQLTGIVSIGFAPAMLMFSLFGGVISEKLDKRTVIQISQALSLAVTLSVGFLVFFGMVHWVHLFIGSMVQGAMFAFQMPARQAAIPSLVGKERLGNAVALNATAMSMMAVLAPGIAGLIYGRFGPEVVYFCIAVLQVIAMIFTSLVPRISAGKNAPQKPILGSIAEGLRYIRRQPILPLMLLQGFAVAILSVPFRSLIQVFGKDAYGSSPAEIGWLFVAVGIGGLFGSLFSAGLRKGRRRGLLVLLSAVLSSAALGLLAGVPLYWVGIFGMIGLGIGEAGRWALGQSLVMEMTEQKYRARVMSVFMMTFGLMPIGVYPLALAMDLFGFTWATGGLAILLGITAIFFLFQPKIRQLS